MPKSRMPEYDKSLSLSKAEAEWLHKILDLVEEEGSYKAIREAAKFLRKRVGMMLKDFRDTALQFKELSARANSNGHWHEDKGSKRSRVIKQPTGDTIAAPSASQIKRILSKRAKKKLRKRGKL